MTYWLQRLTAFNGLEAIRTGVATDRERDRRKEDVHLEDGRAGLRRKKRNQGSRHKAAFRARRLSPPCLALAGGY